MSKKGKTVYLEAWGKTKKYPIIIYANFQAPLEKLIYVKLYKFIGTLKFLASSLETLESIF